ncbi:MAG: hypothetical protein Ct9H300mP23_05710 [Nitrospinota bacterium]|nr:MAG: hypothetical protein Ct9H300mP23_05710 [Nitrospinota bacterium]
MDIIKPRTILLILDPTGGRGGFLLAEGTPEKITKSKNSYTGKYLKEYLYSR